MKTVFADSFYYVALLNRQDEAHQRAVDFCQTSLLQTVTTEWVLTEVADGMAHINQRNAFLALYEHLLARVAVVVIPASHELFLRGIDLYRKRRDKDWSLTDCISFVVMQSHGLTDALTGDRHFEQAGFTALLK